MKVIRRVIIGVCLLWCLAQPVRLFFGGGSEEKLIDTGINLLVAALAAVYFLIRGREYRRQTALAALGANLAALRHDFNMAVEVDTCRFLLEDLDKNDTASAREQAQRLNNLLTAKHRANGELLAATGYNRRAAPEAVALHDLVAAVLRIARLDRRVFTRIVFREEYCHEPLYVRGAPCELYFIIQNLVTNAIAAMLAVPGDERQTLTIATGRAGNGVWICIGDTGAGIKARPRREGFGLWYVRTVLRKYGRLRVEVTPAGTQVRINLRGAVK